MVGGGAREEVLTAAEVWTCVDRVGVDGVLVVTAKATRFFGDGCVGHLRALHSTLVLNFSS